jgi:hypothetical protein
LRLSPTDASRLLTVPPALIAPRGVLYSAPMRKIAFSGACAAFAVALVALPASATDLPLNSPTVVNGIAGVCTGIGDEAQRDPRWAAYSVKIVFAGKGGQFLTDADVTVSRDGKDLFNGFCGGPWLLLKLPAGRYHITGVLDGQHAETSVIAPATGQGRAILRFLASGGAISAEHKP